MSYFLGPPAAWLRARRPGWTLMNFREHVVHRRRSSLLRHSLLATRRNIFNTASKGIECLRKVLPRSFPHFPPGHLRSCPLPWPPSIGLNSVLRTPATARSRYRLSHRSLYSVLCGIVPLESDTPPSPSPPPRVRLRAAARGIGRSERSALLTFLGRRRTARNTILHRRCSRPRSSGSSR